MPCKLKISARVRSVHTNLYLYNAGNIKLDISSVNTKFCLKDSLLLVKQNNLYILLNVEYFLQSCVFNYP